MNDWLDLILRPRYARAKITLRLNAEEKQLLLSPACPVWRSWGWELRRVDLATSELPSDTQNKLGDGLGSSSRLKNSPKDISIFALAPSEKPPDVPYYWFVLQEAESGAKCDYYFSHWDFKHADAYIDCNTITYMVYREILGLAMPLPCLQPSENFLTSNQVNQKLSTPIRKTLGDWPQVWVSGHFLDCEVATTALPVGWQTSPEHERAYFYLKASRTSELPPDPRFPTSKSVVQHKMRTQSRFRALLSLEGSPSLDTSSAHLVYIE